MKISSNYNISINNRISKKQRKKTHVPSQTAFKSLYINKPISNYTDFFSTASLERLLSIYNLHDKVKNFTKENIEALNKVYKSFDLGFSIADFFDFLRADANPDCVEYEKLIERAKKEKVMSMNISNLLKIGKQDPKSDTDFNKINNFLDFRLKAIDNKNSLSMYNHVATSSDVDDIVFYKIKAIEKAIDLIGEDAFLFSFKEKKDNVISFIDALGGYKWDQEVYDELMKKTNPQATDSYSFYEKEIARLKALYPQVKDAEMLECLKKNINDFTRKKRDLLENSIKDPKEKLEKALIIAALNKSNLLENAKELLKVLNPKTLEEKNNYNQILNKILFQYYNLSTPNEIVVEKINLQNSKYLPRLFYANQNFKQAFRSLIALLNMYPEKSNQEIFDNLFKNKQTKQEFESLGIDYDKWSKCDANSKFEIKLNDKNTMTARRVDMNDISKALFLGDEADCCTRVNGTYSSSAVSYITSKMIQAIEVCHNNMPIANTMCYIAKIKDKPTLILDNIEVKKQYQTDNNIRDALLEFAKQLVNEINCPDMPVMLINRRFDIKTSDLKSYYYDMEIVGNTNDDKIYFDFKSNELKINDSTRYIPNQEIIPISPNAPKGRLEMFDNFSIVNDNSLVLTTLDNQHYITTD